MHSNRDKEMAIPRMFNSNTPFIIVTGETELSFLGKEDTSQGCEEEKDSLAQAIAPHLNRVMQHGTAKLVVTEMSQENSCVSIVAQAESEDFQEFSPTNTQCTYSRSQLPQKHRNLCKEADHITDTEDEDFDSASNLPPHHLQRKHCRKSRSQQIQDDREEPPIIRGLWVQEIDWLKSVDMTSSSEVIPPPPQFMDSHSCADVLDSRRRLEERCSSVETDKMSDCDSDCSLDCESVYADENETDSSLCVDVSDLTSGLMHVSGLNSSSHAKCDSESTGSMQSLLGLSDSSYSESAVDESQHAFGFDELRGRVVQIPKLFVSGLFQDLLKQILNDWKTTKAANEGLIFNQDLQPISAQYREGEEYLILHHIQNGSYGDVFCVRDRSTGFRCAAKRIALSHFSSEEVSTWSALNSPRVVELFGAVREGLNVILFMDMKQACLGQLLKKMSCLSEDLALHYLQQTLGALEHLHHRKVLHLDVKADNVLLSADCRDTFLCDFGLSQTLDDRGWSTKAFRGAAFAGTETHMAPEVARGDQLCAKADVWSSCCMLLHMLNGCQPWIRYYSHPLCLQIANEPPPLWEVPSNCNNFTAKVFRAGLQKDPERRATAKELRRMTTKALRAVGGTSPWSVKTACEKLYQDQSQNKGAPHSLSSDIPISPHKLSSPTMCWVSPWRTAAMDEDSNDRDGDSYPDSEVDTDQEWDCEPKSLQDVAYEKDWETGLDSEVDIYMGEQEYVQEKWLKLEKDYEGDWEGEGEEEDEEEEEWDSSVSTEYLRTLRSLFPLLQKGQQTDDNSWGSEAELEYLRDDVAKGTTFQTPSPEPRDDPPSCFSCSDTSQIDASEKDSDHSSDDLSSGVFSSCNSRRDRHLEWLALANQPSSFCFEGIDIWIENVQGECLRIHERQQVKVGHVAIGISDQISEKAFTLETLDRKTVSFELEIKESGVWLRCIPAPDRCQRWTWRVREGKLELRE
ncbi:mitogen-activated protein kinase kinase kinase 14 [Pholidichthys leucotaenia]